VNTEELLRIEILDESGIFQARQVGRAVAAEVHFETQDQIRVATALSEVGRHLLSRGISMTIVFLLERADTTGALVLEIRHSGDDGGPGERLPYEGIAAAMRLMDGVTEETSRSHTVLRLRKQLVSGIWPLTLARPDEIRARLVALVPVTPLEELRRQNQELVQTLDDVQRQRQELIRLNAELEETNQGVLALYTQLSDEMEETNRGVVALYAELDDTSAQLRAASNVKNRFWANISHELRTPLNSVIGLVQLLLGRGGDPLSDEQRHQIRLIESAGVTLLTLVNDLLDLAKAEAGRLEPVMARVDLVDLLAQLRALIRPLDFGGEVTLVVEPSSLPMLFTDEVMLTRILRNLLTNGLKFTGQGEVRLAVRQTGEHAEFVVSDTGIGIPADQHERVFEEFYQVPGEMQIGRTGTGLGLPYARRLTSLLGGSMELTSAPGAGTTVTVRLPLVTTNPAGDPPSLGHVLIVDDDEGAVRMLRALLDGLADRISTAADGGDALALMADDPPDLVLLDLYMPGTDGFEMLDHLDRMGGNTVIVIVTAAELAESPRPTSVVLDKSRLTRDSLIAAVRQAQGGVHGR
jgi:signal transduction histidine kinase/CheY-like chemotaxis protein